MLQCVKAVPSKTIYSTKGFAKEDSVTVPLCLCDCFPYRGSILLIYYNQFIPYNEHQLKIVRSERGSDVNHFHALHLNVYVHQRKSGRFGAAY